MFYDNTVVICPSTPRMALDGAQTILLGWGQVIPWCWRVWQDPRTAGVDVITHIVSSLYALRQKFMVSHQTSTWLFHLGNYESEDQSWCARLELVLSSFSPSALALLASRSRYEPSGSRILLTLPIRKYCATVQPTFCGKSPRHYRMPTLMSWSRHAGASRGFSTPLIINPWPTSVLAISELLSLLSISCWETV